ncbi:fungal-specific transcription factor domain protein [Penicillium lagena]|uniref:fungal-specific transcription factor domain protein n=1 Tax=Penicillium lagena TaxID=94218 RepID=UPI002541041F|nr:fungal-specific transcription factor domain protein [Penicillium lagena]KAJ5619730.1 fungal-specific transcription factor domain protein [Penicillium lagena]
MGDFSLCTNIYARLSFHITFIKQIFSDGLDGHPSGGNGRSGMCPLMRLVCDYTHHPVTAQENEIVDLRSKVQDLERLIADLSNQSSVIPTPDETIGDLIFETGHPSDFHTQALFLEPEIAHHCKPDMPAAKIAVPESISNVLGDRLQVNQIASHYFQSIHVWMPIISKQKLTRIIAGNLRADTALLLLCMKLLCHTPNASNARNAFLYTAAKQFSSSLETAGLLSLRTLQANLLISVYELGHAIYPAAYVSIGLAARQGIALGIHNHSAPQLPRAPIKWIDWEERRRVWWLILILDRIVTLGSYDRPLCTEDPSGTSYVPVDDVAWDQGEMVPPEQVLVSAPSNVMVSPFARLAQSANLAGRIRHCDDDNIEIRDSVERFELLHGTTLSLLELITSTSTNEDMEYSSQALCLR